ncbi:MAG: hypothetical protein ABW162_15900 [Candidatus Sedimenticola sp. PURPLELP]
MKVEDGAAARLLLNSVETLPVSTERVELEERVGQALNSGNPRDRLNLIKAFISQNHSGDPIAAAIAEMLDPVLNIDFHDHQGTNHRKGAVAQAMGLSKGWSRKTTVELAEKTFLVEAYKEQGLSETKAIAVTADRLKEPIETVRYVARKKKKYA